MPDHATLIKIRRMYNVTSDFLLELSDVDPAYVQRHRLERFSKKELAELAQFEAFLFCKKDRQRR